MFSNKYEQVVPKTIFISRDLSIDSILKSRISRMKYRLIDKSLILVSQIRFSHSPSSDWIFFSSKNAIKYFFNQNPAIQDQTRFAVFGKGSAGYLRGYNKVADFVGRGNDANQIAQQFASQINNETVLFPMAIDSIQTVQRRLGYNNVAKNLYVYKTEFVKDFEIPKVEILVFTSPSNVHTYFSKYEIDPEQKVIAIGTTTQRTLMSFNVKNIMVPKSFDERSILETISDAITKTKTTNINALGYNI